MKKIFTILVVTMLVVSCYQEYEVPLPQKDREVLSAPTRLDRYVNGLSFNDSLMVLGPQLENPYAVENMQQARAQLMEEDPSLNIPQITTSHIYARFAPANDDELYTLLQDTTVHFFDFPLDREVISGVYYHDPAIADSLPTYQYVSIPIERWAMNYANSDISHEILEYLCIPEDDEDFWGGIGDGTITPNPGIGTITPIIPENPWIPAPDPGEDGPIGPNNITLSQEDIIDMLVDRAMYLTGNLDSDSDTSTQSVAGTNSSSSRWTPSGRITAYDDIANAQIPLEGVKVHARRWFTTYTGITNADGYFTCDGTFKKPANYCIKWERAYWDIREGWFSQAYYNGPKLQSEWNLNITQNGNKSLRYATIHRAAHRFFYRNDTLTKPNGLGKVKIAYQHRAADVDNVEGRYWLEFGIGIFPDIQIFGFNQNTTIRTENIFSNTSHELGHAAHWTNSTWNYADAGVTGDLNFIESWARCVEYVMTTIEYTQLGLVNSLHQPWYIPVDNNFIKKYLPNNINMQLWSMPENTNSHSAIYTPVFIDLIDDFNQKDYTHSKPNGVTQAQIDKLPTDTLCYPLRQIESIVFDSASLNGVKNHLTRSFNPLVDSNAQEKVDALIAFFEQYQ